MSKNVHVSFTVSQEEAEAIVKAITDGAEKIMVFPFGDENKKPFLEIRDRTKEALGKEMA